MAAVKKQTNGWVDGVGARISPPLYVGVFNELTSAQSNLTTVDALRDILTMKPTRVSTDNDEKLHRSKKDQIAERKVKLRQTTASQPLPRR